MRFGRHADSFFVWIRGSKFSGLACGNGAPNGNSGAICSPENSAPERNPGLKRTRTDTILKTFNVEMNFKL
jgi:hypothetical protein